MRRTTLFFALITARALHAQEPLPDAMSGHLYFGPAHYENAQDSADFTRFRQGLTSVAPNTTATDTYRMVWREDQRSGRWTVSRGDGSLLKGAPNTGLVKPLGSHIPFRTADGRHGWMLVHETPCAMLCQSAVYYVEE